MYSNKVTTFRGADNELMKLHDFLFANEEALIKIFEVKDICRHFIPPRALILVPLGIGCQVGEKIKSMLINRIFNFEEFTTLLTQI